MQRRALFFARRPLSSRRRALSLIAAASALAATPLPAQTTGLLELQRGDTICLLGNALAERMQHDGWLEAQMQGRFPELELSFRNLGFGGDELTVHQRTMNFGKFTADGMALTLQNERFVPWDRYLDHCGADVVFAFFGYNESFAGEAGLAQFKGDLESFVDHVLAQRYGAGEPARLVLFSSTPHEDLGSPSLPDGREHNARIRLYNAVTAEVAAAKGVPFVDVYTPLLAHYEDSDEGPLTINGIHLTEGGNALLGAAIADALLGRGGPPGLPPELLDAIREKNHLWFNRYRATDGYNVYGGRSRKVYTASATGEAFSNWDVLQREMDHLDALCAAHDRVIQTLARGRTAELDTSDVPALIPVLTNKPGPLPRGEFRFHDGDAAVDEMTPAPGMKIELFADERRFPEIANPVQMAWDTRGRLWVAAWPTYPHWTPGQPMNDKLVILEDTDGDGRADKSTVFAGDLHNPTGFEFWNGGVLVASVPDLLFLTDTDGDDRYDTSERLLHGLSSGDTHHSANSFVLGPDGAVYFQEGTFHMSQVESVYGPIRNHNGCVWRFDPRTFRVERYIPYNYANPHGHVFDRWGQDFMTDGTGNVNYYALAFSGYLKHPDKHRGYFPFFKQRSRPCGGTEILSSSHFPAQNQGSYLVANVIGFRGIFQYRFVDDGSGFGAVEMDPIVQSTDQNFRPVDIEVGPDGALYFVDWHNPIIGHLQHHLRDPSRDVGHGRVYRVTYAGRDLAEPPAIAGQPVETLLELLKSPDDRVRYRTRIELSARDSDSVVAAARAWASALDASDPEHEHHLLEALWLHQQHDRMDRELLERLLLARDPRARAAATRVLRYGRHHVEGALELLAGSARDEHPRVRLEAVVAASFFDSADAASVALEVLRQDTDRFLDYSLAETMRALEPRWKAALRAGEPVAAENSAGIAYLLENVGAEELAGLPRVPGVLRALLTRHGVPQEARIAAASELATANGTTAIAEILAAIATVDTNGGAHAAHVIHQLGSILLARSGSQGPSRESLAGLAENGLQPATRALGYAALIAHDGSPERAWATAAQSSAGLESLLRAVPRITDARVRAGLYGRIRPLMFALPSNLASERPRGGGGTGLDAAFYLPPPKDARRATLDELTPRETLRTATFTIDVEPARPVDAFGMTFAGTLYAPAPGSYTLFTHSDDGSRLYIGDRCVVDNDGAHGMKTAEGTIELTAGPHPVLVTYYDQGGGDGLVVSWAGPGFAKHEIPASVLGSRDASAFRGVAIRAMAHVPDHDSQKLRDAARLLGDGALLDATGDLLRAIPRDKLNPDGVRPVLDTLTAYVSGLPPEQRTTPSVAAALELGGELAEVLPASEAATAREGLAGLGGSSVLIRTLPHQMLYDVTDFWVEAGKPVSIVFQNNDVMPHNLVVTAPGALVRVGVAAETLDPTVADARGYVPESDSVLWHSRLLFPGESERVTFVAPEAPGEHPFLCTYPGHWRVMNGVMHVVTDLPGETRVTRRTSDEAPAQAREFVKDWKMADLEPLLKPGWERGRSPAKGRALFTEVGCIKCHTIDGEGAVGGPELTKIQEKFKGADLLRHVVEPSLEVLEGYQFWLFETEDGIPVTGRILKEEGDEVQIVSVLLQPDDVTFLYEDEITERTPMKLSPMPTGLLVTLSEEEILDLLRFLQEPAGD